MPAVLVEDEMNAFSGLQWLEHVLVLKLLEEDVGGYLGHTVGLG